MKYNRNLLNEKEFATYWQSGKHKNHKIYKAGDLNGDGIDDMIAVDPKDHVVGYNERYITDEGKGETPYRVDYYRKPKSERADVSYTEFLDYTEPKQGWKDISKTKENRKNSVWKIIEDYLDPQLGVVKATTKQRELICKKILKIIQTSFFDISKGVPQYQVKVITESPEFKKILKEYVTESRMTRYIPDNAKKELVEGMLQLIQGYGSQIHNIYLKWLNNNQNEHRMSVENTIKLYESIIIKQAANKLYKQYGLTAAEAANNEQLFAQYKQALKAEQENLAKKYATQTYTLK